MIPDAYYKNIFEINYNNLKNRGYTNLFFDIDNTMVPYTEKEPSKDLIKLLDKLKKDGFNIMYISNSRSNRAKKITNALGINGYYMSLKPFKFTYKKILRNYSKDNIVFIGDQFMTDVIGAKRNGLKIILVDKLVDKEPIFTKFWRFFEKIKLKRLNRENKFKTYEYYDNI